MKYPTKTTFILHIFSNTVKQLQTNICRIMPFTFNNILIIGLGLIGSSIARSITKNNAAHVVSAYDNSSESLEEALDIGLIDYGFSNLKDAVKNQDIIIICTPIGTYNNIINEIAPYLEKKTILTDVGSVKSSIIKIISDKIGNVQNFIPGHPIAGSEKSGLLAGNEGLFENKDFIITPLEQNAQSSIDKIKYLWEKLGSKVEEMDYVKHDEIYAKSSHIPHFITFCYASVVIKKYNLSLKEIVKKEGDEFASFVRLAFSNARMWTDIFIYNKEPITNNIEKYFLEPALSKLESKDDVKNITSRVEEAKDFRKTLLIKNKFKKRMKSNDIYTGVLSKLICCLIIESVDSSPKVGGGFLGLTENIVNLKNNYYDVLDNELDEYNYAVSLLINEIKYLNNLIKQSNDEEIFNYIRNINC